MCYPVIGYKIINFQTKLPIIPIVVQREYDKPSTRVTIIKSRIKNKIQIKIKNILNLMGVQKKFLYY